MKGFAVTQPQAEFIAEIKLRNLNKEHLLARVNERESLQKEIAGLHSTRGSDAAIRDLISNQLKEVAKKYGTDRRTAIIEVKEESAPQEEVFVDDYNCRIFLTAHNYFKKISLVSLRSTAEQYLKDDDIILQEIEISNRAEILFFSNQFAVYKMKAYDIADCKASALGEYLTNLLALAEGERIVHMVPAGDYSGFMVFGFANGKVAKVSFDSYATKTNRKKLINAYSDKSPLVSMMWLPADGDLYLTRGKDKAMVINTELINVNASKNSSGVAVFSLKRNTELTGLRLADEMEGLDKEYFRVDKIPSAGHFVTLTMQVEKP
jgi:DNA gyrase subunit A